MKNSQCTAEDEQTLLFDFPEKFVVQNLTYCVLRMKKDVFEKCLAFCKALSNKIGSDTFNFHSKEPVNTLV